MFFTLFPSPVTPFLEYFHPDLAVEDVSLYRGTDAAELFFAALVPDIAAGDSLRANLFTRPPSRWQSRRRTGKKRVTAWQRGMREKVSGLVARRRRHGDGGGAESGGAQTRF